MSESIARQAGVYGRRAKDSDAPRLITGDLNSDGISDSIVLFKLHSLEEPSFYMTHMAGFTSAGGILVHAGSLVVAGPQEQVRSFGIANGILRLSFLAQVREVDGDFYPSVKTDSYVLQGGGWLQVDSEVQRMEVTKN